MQVISDAVKQYLIASNLREESAHTAKRYYMSDMGKCRRMRYLKRKGITVELRDYVYWLFKMGNLLHEYGYTALEAQSLLLQGEEVFGNEHFSGRYDGIINAANEGDPVKKVLFDFKSAGAYQMKKAIAGGENVENIAQVLGSVLLVRETKPELAESGILVYLNKEPGDKMPYISFDREYHLTKIRERSLHEEMDTMIDHFISNKIPRCTCPSWNKPFNAYQPFCTMSEEKIGHYLKLVEDGYKVITAYTKVFTEKDGKRKEESL
jgi:hypothetical protein